MTTIEIILGIIVLMSSTCFGFSVGRQAGFKEGMEFCAAIMQKLTFKIETDKEDNNE